MITLVQSAMAQEQRQREKPRPLTGGAPALQENGGGHGHKTDCGAGGPVVCCEMQIRMNLPRGVGVRASLRGKEKAQEIIPSREQRGDELARVSGRTPGRASAEAKACSARDRDEDGLIARQSLQTITGRA